MDPLLPSLTGVELRSYLARLSLDREVTADVAGITAIHHAHLESIPFENLDVHLGHTITLEPTAVFDKLVTRRRGGFCYEHNTLFARVLLSLGIEVDILSSRVASGPRGWGPPFDHMSIRVTLADTDYLLDVGFGTSFRDPLPIGGWHADSNGHSYRVRRRDDGWVVERRQDEPRMGRLYLADPTPRTVHEFGPMCTVQQTSPEVWFTHTWSVTRTLPDGRVTARPGLFTRTRNGIRRETVITSVGHLQDLLRAEFGMREVQLPDEFPFSDQPGSVSRD